MNILKFLNSGKAPTKKLIKLKSSIGDDIIKFFTRAIIGASMADAPAVATASGWKKNNNGDYVLERTAATDKLADNLSTIAAAATAASTAVLDLMFLGNIVRHPILSAKTAYNTGKNIILSFKTPKSVTPLFNTKLLLEDKENFIKYMDSNGIEFSLAKIYPKLRLSVEESFKEPFGYTNITPKNLSHINSYLTWMDNNFNLSTKKKIVVHPRTYFPPKTVGAYDPDSKIAYVNAAYPKYTESTFIHEAGSHATDKLVANRMIESYPFKLKFKTPVEALAAPIGKFRPDPTILNIYNDISHSSPNLVTTIKYRTLYGNVKPTYGINSDKYSSKWKEARATLNEVRAKLFKHNSSSYSLELLEKIIDSTPDDKLLYLIKDTNAYGYDYYNAYKYLSPTKKKEYLEKIRYALKYLPGASPFLFFNPSNQ